MESNQQKRILLIEDDRKFGRTFEERLKEEGYYVFRQIGVEEGAGVWATMTEKPWDMIISDQRMPGELGSDFLVFLSELEKLDPKKLDEKSPVYQRLRKHYSAYSESQFFEFLQRIKTRPCIRVILSGYAEDDGIKNALEKGIIHKFIHKKTDIDEVLKIIRELLEQHKR